MRHSFFVVKVIILLWAVLAAGQAHASNSVLSSGQWVKLRIRQTGVYTISQAQAQQWGLGSIAQVSVWGNGCATLPRSNDSAYYTDLQQIPSLIDGNQLLFFAEAQHVWNYNAYENFFDHSINEFSEAGYVYITNSQSRIDIARQESIPTPNYTSGSYDYAAYHERNDTNLLQSGRRFWGEIVTRERAFEFDIPNAITDNGVSVKLCAAAHSATASNFTLQVNGGSPYLMDISPQTGEIFATENTALFRQIPYSGTKLNVKAGYSRPTDNSTGYLDFITINARCRLAMGSGQMLFRDAASVAPQRVTRFEMQNTPGGVQIWDVSNIHAVERLQVTQNGTTSSITTYTEHLKTFVAFASQMAYSPEYVSRVPNQDLQGAPMLDFVIITPPAFLLQAQRLALLHEQQDGLRVAIVTTTQVYNEFSSGIPDPTAIRNYLKYRKHLGVLPKYALLFGGGSYINMEGKRGVSLVPTYQSDNSLDRNLSFVSDDYFALLDGGETLSDGGMRGNLDLSIGRLPAANAGEASVLVHKIEAYYAAPPTGWANNLVMIADDGDDNLHVQQTETLCTYIQDSLSAHHINKIYFDKYLQTNTVIGKRYPDVNEAISSAVNAGALVVNYVGHANTQWLAHEQVVTQADIARWNNGGGRLPLFVTATCEFSRFDDYAHKSAGENVLLKPNAGAIAMLSTTRLVYSNGNAALNREFMRQLFAKNEDGQPLALGEMVRRAKNTAGTGVNQLNFTLLGDPALRLHLPSDTLTATSITVNNAATDTLRALDLVTFSASAVNVVDGDTVEIVVYDKIMQKQTLGNGGQTPFTYQERMLIYKGLAVAQDGAFTITFVVPKDINMAYGQGKITYFGQCGNRCVSGSVPIVVGGMSAHYEDDGTPPDITLFIDNEEFKDGGATSETPLFIARLADQNGINATGNGIGRNMTLRLVEAQKTYILNPYYTATATNGTSGRVEFPIPPLPKGAYTVVFKAFDVYNNSSERSIRFVVTGEPSFSIDALYNFPNPFYRQTTFYFTHNRPDAEMDVQINIFSLNGTLQRTLQYTIYGGDTQQYNNYAAWDGVGGNGNPCAAGIYFYKINVRCKTGESAYKSGKLLFYGQ